MIINAEEYAYFEHFGVKGMQWGVRNDKKGAAKKGAAGGVDPGLAIYGAAATALFLGSALRQKNEGGDFHRLNVKKTMKKEGREEPFKTKPSLAEPNMSHPNLMSKVVAPINPNFGQPGTVMNCRRATFAYEMRRRGYDVAATTTNNARGQDIGGTFNATNPGAKRVHPGLLGMETRYNKERVHHLINKNASTPFRDVVKKNGMIENLGETPIKTGAFAQRGDNVFKSLAKNPNRSRGELTVGWEMGGAHSVAWEIVNKKPIIFDAQSGRSYANSAAYMKDLGSASKASYTRLDNKPMNQDFLMRWLKDA